MDYKKSNVSLQLFFVYIYFSLDPFAAISKQYVSISRQPLCIVLLKLYLKKEEDSSLLLTLHENLHCSNLHDKDLQTLKQTNNKFQIVKTNLVKG